MTTPHDASSKRVMRRCLQARIRGRSEQPSSLLGDGRDLAEQPMHFVIDSSGEVEGVCRPGGAPIAEGQGPQPFNRYRLVVSVHKQAVKPSSLQVEGGDLAAAELTDQHSVADAKRD